MAFSIWIAFGGPRPPLPVLPVRVDGCGETSPAHNSSLPLLPSTRGDTEYFWLYRLSYLYNGVFGLICTFVVGLVASVLCNKIFGTKSKNSDPNLFIPFIAKKMRKRMNDDEIELILKRIRMLSL